MARVWTALVTVYLVWGSTYLAIMVGIRTLPPLLMSSVRFLVAVRRGRERLHERSQETVVAGIGPLDRSSDEDSYL
jgi:hypothetical protein